MTGEGRWASGFVCPECGDDEQAYILWMDNTSMAMSLRCMHCEAIWGEPPIDD